MSAVETEAKSDRSGPDMSFLERAVSRTSEIPGNGSGGENRIQNRPQHTAGKVLNVGSGITVAGEIGDCDTLVVEGTVTATLSAGRALDVSQGGTFMGAALVEDAWIAGQFDGDLTVNGRLHITTSGCVTGKIRYGRLEIESGGELNGDISVATSGD